MQTEVKMNSTRWQASLYMALKPLAIILEELMKMKLEGLQNAPGEHVHSLRLTLPLIF